MSDDKLIKWKTHKKVDLTVDQVKEIIKCTNPVTGYKYFMENYFYIQHPTKGQLLYKPFEFQVGLIDNYHSNRLSISMMSRQTGKTTSAAGYLLWFAMFQPDQTVLIAAHQYSGAQEIMDRIRYAYEMCPYWLKASVEAYNKGNIDFANKSRIVARATTEKTGRGMSLSLLYLDEFAFVRPNIATAFWTSISPALSTGGKCIITSTPNSDEDKFSNLWREANDMTDDFGNATTVGKNGYSPYKAYWWQHPERDEAWKAREIAQLGIEKFRREHDLEFIIDEETLVDPMKLLDMESKNPLYKTGQVRWYKKPVPQYTYVVGLDPSMGTGGDYAAIEVFEAETGVQVAEWKHNKTTCPEQVRLLVEINKQVIEVTNRPNNLYYTFENNSLGEAVLQSIEDFGEHNIPGTLISESKRSGGSRRYRKGFNTGSVSKREACSKLKSMVEGDRLIINSTSLISELKTFIATGDGFKAKLGQHDDLVMSTLLVVRVLNQLRLFNSRIDKHVRDHGERIAPMPFLASFGY